MKRLPRFVVLLVTLLLPPFLSSCDQQAGWLAVSPAFYLLDNSSSKDTKTSPVGADIAGSWSGKYWDENTGDTEPVTAEVSQDGDAVVITTSRTGSGHNLTGTIKTNAEMLLTDSYDGQRWSTWTPVTHNAMDLLDYDWQPVLGEPDPPLQHITLSR